MKKLLLLALGCGLGLADPTIIEIPKDGITHAHTENGPISILVDNAMGDIEIVEAPANQNFIKVQVIPDPKNKARLSLSIEKIVQRGRLDIKMIYPLEDLEIRGDAQRIQQRAGKEANLYALGEGVVNVGGNVMIGADSSVVWEEGVVVGCHKGSAAIKVVVPGKILQNLRVMTAIGNVVIQGFIYSEFQRALWVDGQRDVIYDKRAFPKGILRNGNQLSGCAANLTAGDIQKLFPDLPR